MAVNMRRMKNILGAALAGVLLAGVLLAGCTATPSADSGAAAEAEPPPAAIVFTDALGHEVILESWDRVASLYGSFAETWLLAGGTLAGTTEDAVSERGLELGEDVAVVGTVKEPSLEEILALSPDFVVLSADVAGQVKLHGALEAAEEPLPDFVRYRFEFWEDCGGYDGGLTALAAESGNGGGGASAPAPQAARVHTVGKGDTLWGIARRYGVELAALIRANPQIKNPNLIYPGGTVRVP